MQERGFTLVELAIVLVIIGIILGIILKGKEIVHNARTKALYNEYREISAAMITYLDRYKKWPGDDDEADDRWPGMPAGDGDGVIGFSVQYCDTGSTHESCLVWRHLRMANLITGDASDSESPTHPFGFRIGVGHGHSLPGGGGWPRPLVCFEWVPAEVAEDIDRKYDDGNVSTGDIRAFNLSGDNYQSLCFEI